MQRAARPIETIRGRVVDEQGLPVTSFRVTSSGPGHRSGPKRDRPDFGNSFELRTRDRGEWYVWVKAEGYQPAYSEFRVPLEEELVIVLKPAGTLTVRVVDSMLEPLARAEVRTRYAAGQAPHDWHRTKTDVEGVVQWTDLPLGRLHVIADVEGQGTAVSDVIELTAEQREQEILLTLSPGGEIHGVAYGQPGVPEWGLELKLRWSSSLRDDPLWLFGRTLRTNAEGEFSFAGIPAGAYTITSGAGANPTKAIPVCSVDATVADGERVAVELVLEDGLQVAVRGVVIRDGQPLIGVEVEASDTAYPFAGLARETTTDETGGFTMNLLHGGSVTFEVTESSSAQGCYNSVSQTEEVSAVGNHKLRMEYRTGSVRGRVLDSGSVPVAGASVMASRYGDDLAYGLSRSFAITEADEDGVFVLFPLAAGTYSISCAHVDLTGRTRGREVTLENVEVRESARTDGVLLVLPGPADLASITGRVTNPDGAPALAARIEIRAQTPSIEDLPPHGVVTDAEGIYRVEGLVGPSYWMRSVRENLTSAWAMVETQRGRETSCDFTLEQGAFLPVRFAGVGPEQETYVSVRDKEGRKVDWRFLKEPSGALVRLFRGLTP